MFEKLIAPFVPWWGRLALVAVVLIAAVAFGALKMHGHDEVRYDALDKAFETFKSQTAFLGSQAKAAAVKQAAIDKQRKENADEKYRAGVAALNDDIDRVRRERASGSFVPPARPGSTNPERACFDRTELESAIREFDEEVSGQIEGCNKGIIGLDAAKFWNSNRKTSP